MLAPLYPQCQTHCAAHSRPQWFDSADTAVAGPCRAALATAVSLGASLVPVIIPELEQLRVAGSLIILTELAASNKSVMATPALKRQVRGVRVGSCRQGNACLIEPAAGNMSVMATPALKRQVRGGS